MSCIMARDVFVSYSHEDQDIAVSACARIEDSGTDCWIAPRNVMPGAAWSGAIIDAIIESRVMVFVFSSHSNNSPHAIRELGCAISKGTQIIPFRIENVRPSRSIEYFIATAHWLNALPQPSDEHFELLAETVKHLLSGKGGDDLSLSNRHDPNRETVLLAAPVGAAQPSRGESLPVSHQLTEYGKGLRSAESLCAQGKWIPCIKTCGDLFDKSVRLLLSDLLSSLDNGPARVAILNAAKKESGLKTLGLEDLSALYQDQDVFEAMRCHLTSNLQRTKQIDWSRMVQWDSAARDKAGSDSPGENEALEIVYWLKLFLYDVQLAGGDAAVDPVPEEERRVDKCPCCETPVKKNWKFCAECGEPVKLTCEACHRVLAPDFKICPYCESTVNRRGGHRTEAAQKGRNEYKTICEGAYLDGVVNARERKLMENKRLELGLNAEEAEAIERKCAPASTLEYTRLVEGVLVDEVISDAERAFLEKKARELRIDSWLADKIEEAVLSTMDDSA